MKKILITLLIILTIGCTNKEIEKKTKTNNEEEIKEETIEPIVEEYQDVNPIIVGLYNNGK